MQMKRITLRLIFLAGLPVLAACSAGGAAETAPEPKALTLIATDIAYSIKQIDVTVGRPVQLTLENQGVLEHDFSIVEIPLAGEVVTLEEPEQMQGHEMGHEENEPAVHIAVPTSDRGTIEFTPAAPGEYVYYCTVSGHREAGMEGVLVVR